MSSNLRWREVCRPPHSISFDASKCCSPVGEVGVSPIDNYLRRTADIVLIGAPDSIAKNSSLGRLILLGVVSEVESFFKQVLGGCVRLCNSCRRSASSHVIPFAAVDYYENDDIEYALVESISFATNGEIVRQTKKLTGLDLGSSPELKTAVQQFDHVCHLRHAAVHASGILGTGNIREISRESRMKLQVDLQFAEIQTIVAICHNLVREYNRALYSKVIDRWLDDKLLKGDWQVDRNQFAPVFQLFHSVEDSCGPSNAYNAYRSLRPTLLRRLSGPA